MDKNNTNMGSCKSCQTSTISINKISAKDLDIQNPKIRLPKIKFNDDNSRELIFRIKDSRAPLLKLSTNKLYSNRIRRSPKFIT